MRSLLLVTLSLLLTASSAHAAEPTPLLRAHAHNDYEHTRPLLDALECGFGSIEADIHLGEAVHQLVEAGPLPGQCGIVIGHGKRIVSAEVFASPELLEANWEALVRAALLDVPSHIEGRPSVSRALRFVNRLATASANRSPGVGLGEELHVRTTRLVGQALTLNGAVVHASAFALAA